MISLFEPRQNRYTFHAVFERSFRHSAAKKYASVVWATVLVVLSFDQSIQAAIHDNKHAKQIALGKWSFSPIFTGFPLDRTLPSRTISKFFYSSMFSKQLQNHICCKCKVWTWNGYLTVASNALLLVSPVGHLRLEECKKHEASFIDVAAQSWRAHRI